jgi:hypothetical protein
MDVGVGDGAAFAPEVHELNAYEKNSKIAAKITRQNLPETAPDGFTISLLEMCFTIMEEIAL